MVMGMDSSLMMLLKDGDMCLERIQVSCKGSVLAIL